MEEWLNNVTYGAPTDNFIPYLKKGSYGSLMEELYSFPFYPNSSDATKDEIRELINLQTSPEQSNEKLRNRWMVYDKSIIDIFKKLVREKIMPEEVGEIETLIDKCVEDVSHVLIKMKYRYQRPRPYQMAQYFKARLFPFASTSAHTPSYPSGHVFQAVILTELLGTKFPEYYSYLKDFTEDIASSRMFLGLHFASDIHFAYKSAKIITSSKEFTTKYGIKVVEKIKEN